MTRSSKTECHASIMPKKCKKVTPTIISVLFPTEPHCDPTPPSHGHRTVCPIARLNDVRGVLERSERGSGLLAVRRDHHMTRVGQWGGEFAKIALCEFKSGLRKSRVTEA